ncbi:MAG TPA: glycosyltransferase family 39 protein [Candidatus Acidoferrum sp.]|nr:glycosyltransferase family 39 protein [Candidatus Acidoferrum sp.]
MSLTRLYWPVVALFVLSAGWLEVRSARDETQTWDEGIHISAGYAYLTRGDYSWNMEHPPLVKIMSAVPLLFLGLEAHPFQPDGKRKDQVANGVDFLYRNRRNADTILIAARAPTILLTALFTLAFAWWMRRCFGVAAGLLAAALLAFDPNLMAHGRYVTTDVPLTAFYFVACVLWVEYLERGGLRRLALAAAAIALAMVIKFSAILLGPPLVLLFAIRWWQRPKEFGVARAAGALAMVLVMTLAAIAVVYWPQTAQLLSRKLAVENHTYVTGINDVVLHNEGGHESYLLGVRSNKGWWYYFPVVFAVKSTVTAIAGLFLVLVAGLWAAARGLWRRVPLMVFGLALPPLVYFILSMTSGINLGVRHILPIYPFLYAGIAAALSQIPMRRAAAVAMVVLGVGQIAECATITPDYLAFFNAMAGGPGRGPEYLVDSNIDWGQDVKKLVHWLDAHGTRRARIYYFGNAQMRYYGVDEIGWPDPLDQKGWDEVDDFCVANVTPLYGVYAPLDALAPLRLREPVAKIGWSMYVYDLRKKK